MNATNAMLKEESFNITVGEVFKKEDLKECTQFFLDLYSKPPWCDKWEDFDHAKNYLSEYVDNPSNKGFILKKEDKIISFCFGHKKSWWQGAEFYIDEFVVNSISNAEILIDYMKETLKKENIDNITLVTERNFTAQTVYSKRGFKTNKDLEIMYCKF